MGEKDEEVSASSKSDGAPNRPTTISLPPRPYGESFFNGGGLGFSPGPMTSLVSSFFSDSDDFKSFSQLLAGAMVSPAARSAGGDGGAVDPRFKQNRPAGLAITQASSPMFTFPPELSPGILLDSPSFFGLFSPVQGHFGMTHQQALAQVTLQAAQANSPMHIQPESLTTNAATSVVPYVTTGRHQIPTSVTESSELSVSETRSNVDKPADDGYNWRKYGQKAVKGSEFPRSYYKCTAPGCQVKKKVERSRNGQVTEIIYKSQHNHEPPQNNRRGKDGRNLNGRLVNASSNPDSGSRCETGGLNRYKKDNEASQATTEQISEATDSEEVGNTDTGIEINGKDEPDPKRRSIETRVLQPASLHKTVTEPRIIVQTTSEVDLLDDGYRWRKYGQKVVKGNPYPRSYYKCTTPGCNVRKHVERAAADPKAVVTAYEGKHNHDLPAARTSSHTVAANSQLRRESLNPSNMPQQPAARLRLKEEQIT